MAGGAAGEMVTGPRCQSVQRPGNLSDQFSAEDSRVLQHPNVLSVKHAFRENVDASAGPICCAWDFDGRNMTAAGIDAQFLDSSRCATWKGLAPNRSARGGVHFEKKTPPWRRGG